MMFGPEILVASLTARNTIFKHGNRWQYHSRSDHHSKVACWGLMFDLMRHCALLRQHAAAGLVGYGLNHEMSDFGSGRKKNLDLVVCRPRGIVAVGPHVPSLAEHRLELELVLNAAAQTELDALPPLYEYPVGSVHIALEAKACMTAHLKARPRLFDELNSSHQAIHGNSPHAIAAGLAMINISREFISPGLNDFPLAERPAVVSTHEQPRHTAAVIEKIREIRRRTRDSEEGFDSLGIVVISCRNDGSPVTLVSAPPAPQPGDTDHYEMTVHRLAQLYEQRFRDIAI